MPTSEETLLAFYGRDGRDIQGRTHSEILAWSDAALEAVHDYIQWLFPVPEPSSFNPTAPRLTPRIRDAFLASDAMSGRLRASLLRMLRFYGLCRQPDGTIVPASFYPDRSTHWLTPSDHNHLRLTRILRSLHFLGLKQESAALLLALQTIYTAQPPESRTITADTYRYWQTATVS